VHINDHWDVEMNNVTGIKKSTFGKPQTASECPFKAYIHNAPELRAIAGLEAMKPAPINEFLLARAVRLLFEGRTRFTHSPVGADVPKDSKHYIPGAVIFSSQKSKTHDIGATSVECLELWDMEPTGIAAQLHKRLQDENERLAPTGPDNMNTVVWVAGRFGAQVMPVVVVDLSGKAQCFFLLGPDAFTVSERLMAEALRLMTIEVRAGADAPGDSPISQKQYVEALSFAYTELETLKTNMVAERRERSKEALLAQSTLNRERESLSAENLLRRKAVVSAKNQQIDALTQRLKDSDRVLAEAKRVRDIEIAQLRAELQCRRAGDVLALVPVIEVSAPVLVDESNSHWRETVEHQAEVMRQMRVTERHLSEELASAQGKANAAPVVAAKPRKLCDIADWAAENADRVIVLKRAIHACKKGTYEDPELVYAALDTLATSYRDVKLGLADRMAFKVACEKLGLDYGGSIAECAGDEYFFDWKGHRTFMDQHVGRGVSRDPRFCFRCYFTWDAEESKVVIGWLPSHLPTRAT
jgi:hypothetical protein